MPVRTTDPDFRIKEGNLFHQKFVFMADQVNAVRRPGPASVEYHPVAAVDDWEHAVPLNPDHRKLGRIAEAAQPVFRKRHRLDVGIL